MTTQETSVLDSLTEGLKLKDVALSTLFDSVNQQESPYDFFRILATHLIPYIQKNTAFKTLIKRWERKTRSSHKEINALENVAIEEVTNAYDTLAKRLQDHEPLVYIKGLAQSLEKARSYLNGTIPVYMSSHYEMAAAALAKACKLLLAHNQEKMVSDLVEFAYFKDKREPPGIARCYFYSTISKILKKRQQWGGIYFDQPHICWSYLRLFARCWNLEVEDLENEKLKSETIQDCRRSTELLGLHGFWEELQHIRNRLPVDASFFTIARFSKYLEVIGNEILISKTGKGEELAIFGLHALNLEIFGDSLLLLIEIEEGRTKTPYLLHTFNTESHPYLFIKEVIMNPNKDWVPSDVGMKSGSSPNLLNRAKIKGIIKSLFIKKGKRKGSAQLTSKRIIFNNLNLSTQIAFKTQLDTLKSNIYNPKGISLPNEWLTEKIKSRKNTK